MVEYIACKRFMLIKKKKKSILSQSHSLLLPISLQFKFQRNGIALSWILLTFFYSTNWTLNQGWKLTFPRESTLQEILFDFSNIGLMKMKAVWDNKKEWTRSLEFYKCKVLGFVDNAMSAHLSQWPWAKHLNTLCFCLFIFIMKSWMNWPFSSLPVLTFSASLPFITIQTIIFTVPSLYALRK